MEDFWFYTNYGVNHVLDINGYDHVLFLIVLAIPYLFKDWKRVLLLVSVFTIGHTFSLLLAAYNVVSIEADLVEFLIPVTILIVAIYNVFKAGKKTRKIAVLFISTLFFGLIHGLGFAREFTMLIGKAEQKIIPLLEFALGIEVAQVIVVFLVLFIGFLCQTVFRISKRDWILVISAIVVGLVIPMLINCDFLA
jgi:hypothetical protein